MNPFPRIFNTTLFSPLLQCGPSWGMLYEEVRLAMRCVQHFEARRGHLYNTRKKFAGYTMWCFWLFSQLVLNHYH